ncbi:MAG: 2-amino-4-hydroxy-6-hydroxymethyldihydropteridine diphosphokinase [Oleiphilaceae bacterium]|jgi:2-amino-4-hydroxy-6-hydroxymethyldihydropteridine diphosphokinase
MTTLTKNTDVLIGLGSNLDQPKRQVINAINAIINIEGCDFQCASSLYESLPQGPQDQENFCNAVVLVSTNLPPEYLLYQLQTIENNFGRIKTRHWGERVIDLDILYYGQSKIDLDTPDLHIPHRHALARDFVIIPALEITPDWCLPDGTRLEDYQEACLNHQLKKIIT